MESGRSAYKTHEQPLVLTIDIGSSSTRVLLYDREGRAVEGVSSQERYRLRSGPDGTSEDDPDTAVERTARCIDAALQQAGPLATQIGAVAVDTLVTNILAVDGRGHPLTPLITYADTRSDPDAERLRAGLDEAEVHERTGCLLRAGYWPALLAWFRRVQPRVWSRAARWITLGEYLEWRLFGRCRAGLSVASWGGLLDRHTLTWDAPLLEHLGLDESKLSTLVDVDAALSGLRPPFAARWPALRDVPWYPAVGDGAAANVGSGCTGSDRVALTLGTSGAMRVIQSRVERVPAGLWCYRVDRQYALLGGATSEGGNVYGWLQRTLQLGTGAEVEASVATLMPDSHGLTVLPFFAGERSPNWAGHVQATIHGLTLSTTTLDIVRASMEAVAYRFALIHDRVCDEGGCSHRVVASGGGLLHSPTWMQIFADVLGRPVIASAEDEATSRGAAILALRSLGAIPSVASLPATDGAVYEPNSAHHAIYKAAIARQSRLYSRVLAPE